MLKRLPLLIAVAALAFWLGNFIIKNFLAVSLIAYGEDAASRDQAVAYAPSNPAVVAARGKYLLYRAEPAQPEEALAELERAVKLSPHDYRFWLELGRAYESLGEVAQAGNALGKAVALAPRYFDARWALANYQLRVGNTGQALEEFRQAIDLSGRGQPDEKVTLNVYHSVAGALGNHHDILRRITAPDEVSQSLLARFFASQDAFDQAIEIWRKTAASDQASYRKLTVELIGKLLGKGRFTDARDVWNGFERLVAPGGAPEGVVVSGGMINADFERAPINERFPELAEQSIGFDWIIRAHPEVRQRRTGYGRHGGAYSLYLSFAASMSSEFDHISQIVAVEPDDHYRLEYFVKARNVPADRSDAPFVEVSDVLRPERFALRSVLPGGNTDWHKQSLTFTVPSETWGLRVSIRNRQIVRVDPSRIAEVWFDDFNLEKLTR